MSTMTVLVFCCVVATVYSETIVVNNESYQIVHTQYGTVRGRENVTLFDGRVYYSFRGIPYAKPPVNELRFKVSVRCMPYKLCRCHYNCCLFNTILATTTTRSMDKHSRCIRIWQRMRSDFGRGNGDIWRRGLFVPERFCAE